MQPQSQINQLTFEDNQNLNVQNTPVGVFQPSASLYVGDLHPEVNEAILFQHFSEIGAVASIRVCRDAITRRSLGYAYVNFHNPKDAENAAQTLNGTLIRGRPCRIMWSQRDPSLRKSGKGNIFIKNLDKSIDGKALSDTFSEFGNVLSCKVELDENGVSKGYGYIQFQTQEAADLAIQKVNGKLIANKPVFVGPFVPRRERLASSDQNFTNLYIKNLDPSIDDEKLINLFSEFGPIKSAVVMKSPDGKSRGFGFVNFQDSAHAKNAVQKMNEKEIEGRNIYVGRAQKKFERESDLRQRFEQYRLENMSKYQGVNLYVKNLEDDMTDEKLRQIFAPYGTITSSKVMTDFKGASKGFGFVCFDSSEAATKAVAELNMKMFGSKPLYVALAQPKAFRRSQLEAQFAQRAKMMSYMGRGAPMINYYPNPVPMFYPSRGYYPPGPQGMRGRARGYPSHNYPNVPHGGRGMVKSGRGFSGNPFQGGPPRGAPYAFRQPGGQQFRNYQQPHYQPPPYPQQPNSEELKRQLAETLYAKIVLMEPTRVGKITGMIYEGHSVEELREMLENPAKLKAKVDEAVVVLTAIKE